MPILCPQRDALETLQTKVLALPEDFGEKRAFRLSNGTPLHLLGVSTGASARVNPNLHIAIFGRTPPAGAPQNAECLAKCRFAALLSGPGPGDGNQLTVEGLNFETAWNNVAVLSLSGHRAVYRPTV